MPQLDEIAILMANAFNGKKANDLAFLYDRTAILMPPGEPAVEGRTAIQQWFAAALVRLGTIQIVPSETRAFNDLAFQVGTFTTIASDASVTGKYVLILHRTDEGWLIRHDIWNLNQMPRPTT